MPTRALISNTTRNLVYHSIRHDPRVTALRNGWPAVNQPMLSVWQPHLIQVRAIATDRVGPWMGSWLPQWRSTAAPPSAGEQDSQPRTSTAPETSGSPSAEPADPKHLPPAQLMIMMERSDEYVVHRTGNPEAGTCKVALDPEYEQDKMKNPMQETGIWGAMGLEGLPGYGAYRVVFQKTVKWERRDLPAMIYPERHGSLSPDEAVGWFHEDDWQMARASRKSQ